LPWAQTVALIGQTCVDTGARLVVIDTLAQFVPEAEGSAAKAGRAMAELQQLRDQGIGVIVTRHERKAGGQVGDSGRGSSALTGAVDIVLALTKPDGHTGNKRVISASSRFLETQVRTVVEFQDGTYVHLPDEDVVASDREAKLLTLLPTDPGEAIPVDDLLFEAGLKKTAGRGLLARMVRDGKAVAIGKGTRGSPLRYHLPAAT